MTGKVLGIPLILVLLVLAIVIPVAGFVYSLHLAELRAIGKCIPVTVVKTVEKQVFVTPTVTPSLKKGVKVSAASVSGSIK